jgi:hypothetical protein
MHFIVCEPLERALDWKASTLIGAGESTSEISAEFYRFCASCVSLVRLPATANPGTRTHASS